ncbi:10632_t:CDS:2 [Ambispora leptoticha]|uniref:10632_t:CDS:1 n=1 Tax=Ambispora leptoticha TaxID=144679 RepID=A0A9N8W2D2_9GLOM|nr:10632_t:CDS:2 [Ambispora leptoticha]
MCNGGDISQFDKALDNKENFYIVDARIMEWCSVYKILLAEKYIEAFKWPDLSSKVEHNTLDKQIVEADLVSCMNSIDKAGMPKDTVSDGLIHLDVNSTFTEVVYRS